VAVVPGGDLDRILSRDHGGKWVIRFYINTHTRARARDASMLYIIYNIYIYNSIVCTHSDKTSGWIREEEDLRDGFIQWKGYLVQYLPTYHSRRYIIIISNSSSRQ